MPVTINVRLYGETKTIPIIGEVKLAEDHVFDGIHDADPAGPGRITLYLDLAHPTSPDADHPGSSIDVTGTVTEISELIKALSEALAENVEADPNLAWDGLSDEDKRFAADGWLGYGGQ